MAQKIAAPPKFEKLLQIMSSFNVLDQPNMYLITIECPEGHELYSGIEYAESKNDFNLKISSYTAPTPQTSKQNISTEKQKLPGNIKEIVKMVAARYFICDKYKHCIVGQPPTLNEMVRMQNPQNYSNVIIPTFTLFDYILTAEDLIYIEANKAFSAEKSSDGKIDNDIMHKNTKEYINFIVSNQTPEHLHAIDVLCNQYLPPELLKDTSAQPSTQPMIPLKYDPKNNKKELLKYCQNKIIENFRKIKITYNPIKEFYPIFMSCELHELEKYIKNIIDNIYINIDFNTFFRCVMNFYIYEPSDAWYVINIFKRAIKGTVFETKLD